MTSLLNRHRRVEAWAYRAVARARGAEPVAGAAEADAILHQLDAANLMRDTAAALASSSPGERDVLLLHVWENLMPRTSPRIWESWGSRRSRSALRCTALAPGCGRCWNHGVARF